MAPSRSVTANRPNRCFACGEANPDGLHLRFDYIPVKKAVECRLRLHSRYQGAIGYAHGGMIATLLDEAMAKVNGKRGIRAVTLRLNVFYRKMVPVEEEIQLIGRITRRRGRKLYLSSQIQDHHGTVLARATGVFLEVSPSNESDSKRST